MSYSSSKKQMFNLSDIGANRLLSLEDLVNEIRCTRRDSFFERILSLKAGETFNHRLFDAITFLAVTEDFTIHFDYDPKAINYEGSIEYRITAGNDWVWHLKTTITWNSILPIVYGCLDFHTNVVSKSNQVKSCINEMTGTNMKVEIISNNLKILSHHEVLKRDGIIE